MQIFIHLVFCHFLLLEFLFLSFFYSKKPSAFWQFVLEAVEAAWGQKSIKWLIRHKFPLLRTTTSLISWHKIQNWGHTRSLKCLKTSPMTLYISNKCVFMLIFYICTPFTSLLDPERLLHLNFEFWVDF